MSKRGKLIDRESKLVLAYGQHGAGQGMRVGGDGSRGMRHDN